MEHESNDDTVIVIGVLGTVTKGLLVQGLENLEISGRVRPSKL